VSDAPLAAPPLARRLACFLYEGVLLFGVVFVAALLYGVATSQRNAMIGRQGLGAVLFTVLGIYYVACWSRGGQTLPMKTWHIRLVDAHGGPVSAWRAMARYVLSWLWFVPALAIAHWVGLHGAWQMFGVMAAGVLVFAGLSFLHPQRQYLHDALCGTRLITWRPAR
jgi:uncharacterized RDD family membrane protein YckC